MENPRKEETGTRGRKTTEPARSQACTEAGEAGEKTQTEEEKISIFMKVGEWIFSIDHGQLCRVWLPGRDYVVRVPLTRLAPLEDAGTGTTEGIAYVAAAARVADALTQDVLLAPIESSVISLPHQIRALSRAIAGDRVRYLLADEVGMGKTVEAGLILRELKLRGLPKNDPVLKAKDKDRW